MPSRVSRLLVAAVAVTLLASAAPADAKPARRGPSQADQRFREGQRLMNQHKYAEACPKLEESHLLAPKTRTILLLAECHERTGNAAVAHVEYQEALARARREPKGAALVRRAEQGIRDTQAAAASAAAPPSTPPPSTPPETPSTPPASSSPDTAKDPSTTDPVEPTEEPTASTDPSEDERDPPRHTGVVLGLDTLLVLYEQPPGAAAIAGGPGGGTMLLSVASGGYDLSPSFRLFGAMGFARNAPPAGDNGFALSNPALGARYTFFFDAFRLALHGGVILPIGSGGGDRADVPVLFATQRARGVYAELFDPNYFTVWLGADVGARFGNVVTTGRLELDESLRARGEAASPDAGKGRLHVRGHVGYIVVQKPQLEPFIELRYQTFISSPAFLRNDPTGRDILLGSLGVALRVSPVTVALSYMRPLDPPLTRDNQSMFRLTLGAEL